MVISQTERAIATWSQLILQAAATTGAIDQEKHHARLAPGGGSSRNCLGRNGRPVARPNAAHPTTSRARTAPSCQRGSRRPPRHRSRQHGGRHARGDRLPDRPSGHRPDPAAVAVRVRRPGLPDPRQGRHRPVHGDARAISALLTRRPEDHAIPADQDTAAAWAVNPWAAPTHAQIPLRPPAREQLGAAADRLVEAAATAMSTGSFLDHQPLAPPTIDPPGIEWHRGSPPPRLDFGSSAPAFDR
jgi:hypothetical protein